MTVPSRSVSAVLFAILGPLLYLSHDRITLPIPNAVTPVLPPISRLQQYLRLRTDHPQPDYDQAVHFLNYTVSYLLPNASTSIHYFLPRKPVLLVSLQATQPSLPSVLLNSHTDVVPAEPEKWNLHPFAARAVVKDGQFRIYARGAQDMKSVGMQYLEALSQLTSSGWRPTRSVHLSYVPDEEIGGIGGMARFVTSPVFTKLNVGVVLDEGLPHPKSNFNVYYGERQTWWLAVRVEGNPGHGASIPQSTATAVLHEIIGRALNFRRSQLAKLQSDHDLGSIVGVNVAYLKAGTPDEHIKGGHVMNMIPSHARAGFDIRVPPTVSREHMEAEVERWMTCADQSRCPGVTYDWVHKVDITAMTSRDPIVNPYAKVFKDGLEKAGIANRLVHGIFPAATDARYLRDHGIPCFGFSPIENTPSLLHKHNEYITVEGYMKGVRIYKNLIQELADYDPEAVSQHVDPELGSCTEAERSEQCRLRQAD